jgi:hypothetical protein
MGENLPQIIKDKGEVASFGGNSLTINLEQANKAIAKMEWTERIWDRSRSQWALKHLVHSYPSHWRNLRQVSAEMQRKRDALREAKYNYAEELAQVEINRAQIEELNQEIRESDCSKERTLRAKIQLLEIENSKKEELTLAIIPKIEGALKELRTLEGIHDELVKAIAEKEGVVPEELSESHYEKQEVKSCIKHAFIQAIREMRISGNIQTGVQEYIEQCGINALSARRDIAEYLVEVEAKAEDLDNSKLFEFLENMADKYCECAGIQASIMGFSENHNDSIAYMPVRDDRK